MHLEILWWSLYILKNSHAILQCCSQASDQTHTGFLPLLLEKTLWKRFYETSSSGCARVVLAFQQEQQMCSLCSHCWWLDCLPLLIFSTTPVLLLPPGQMDMLLYLLGQVNLFHFFPLRSGERAFVSFFCGCKHFKITVVKNNYGCFLAWFLDFHHHSLNMAPER